MTFFENFRFILEQILFFLCTVILFFLISENVTSYKNHGFTQPFFSSFELSLSLLSIIACFYLFFYEDYSFLFHKQNFIYFQEHIDYDDDESDNSNDLSRKTTRIE